jgi:hypothetical protein
MGKVHTQLRLHTRLPQPEKCVDLALGLQSGDQRMVHILSADLLQQIGSGLVVWLAVQREARKDFVMAQHGPRVVDALRAHVAGTEIGGACKNVIALACGMASGVGLGENTSAAIITRGLAEIIRLGIALGAKVTTLAGLAGATKAIAFGLATLTDVGWQMSGEVVLMTLLGGMGTLLGPVLGAAIIVTMQNYLANLGSMVSIIMGLTFVVCVLLFRRGIVGEIAHRLGKKA